MRGKSTFSDTEAPLSTDPVTTYYATISSCNYFFFSFLPRGVLAFGGWLVWWLDLVLFLVVGLGCWYLVLVVELGVGLGLGLRLGVGSWFWSGFGSVSEPLTLTHNLNPNPNALGLGGYLSP